MHVISKKQILFTLFLIVFALALIVGVPASVSAYLPKPQFVVVIDAGHGGIDGGVKGIKTGVKESELNLIIAQKLSRHFKSSGVSVVLTRKDENGLYGITGKGNMKRTDMQKRAKIIKEADANLVISIHMNFFPSAARRGAQVFYNPRNAGSVYLSKCLQDELNTNVNSKHSGRSYIPLRADLFLLKCSEVPSVVVECGFLSNPLDEQLLIDEKFQFELSYYIFSGAMSYLMTKDNNLKEDGGFFDGGMLDDYYDKLN